MMRQPEMSPENRCWREHAAWLEDYKRWREEHRQALGTLVKVQAAILERESALEREAAEVQAHQIEMADFLLLGSLEGPPDPEQQLAAHAEFAKKHEQAREMHARAKQQHVNVVEEIEKLLQVCQLAT